MRIRHIVYLSFICCSCNQNTKSISVDKSDFDSLKIQPQSKIDINDKKNFHLFCNYYNRFGIAIQNYFRIIDSLAIDINSDKLIDTILVVSPISLDDQTFYDTKYDSAPKRLIVEVLNLKGKSKIRNVYRNLISDIGGVGFNYLGLGKTLAGFEINHGAGNKASWNYYLELSSINPDSLTIKKIRKECTYNDETINLEYFYSNVYISNFNIQDTIKLNCNCDKAWSMLIKKNK